MDDSTKVSYTVIDTRVLNNVEYNLIERKDSINYSYNIGVPRREKKNCLCWDFLLNGFETKSFVSKLFYNLGIDG